MQLPVILSLPHILAHNCAYSCLLISIAFHWFIIPGVENQSAPQEMRCDEPQNIRAWELLYAFLCHMRFQVIRMQTIVWTFIAMQGNI